MAKEIGTSDLIETWASNGSVIEPTLGKQNDGWQFEEQPPHETMNWIHNLLGQQINYLMRAGIPEWNAATDYVAGSCVVNDDVIWLASAPNANSEPTSGNTNWTSFDPSAFAPAERGVPAGALQAFAMNSAPAGWLSCNGAAMSRTTYGVLFSAIGTTFGSGDGTTTFNLPDLRGKFVRGHDAGRGVDAGRGFGVDQEDAVGILSATNGASVNKVFVSTDRRPQFPATDSADGIASLGLFGDSGASSVSRAAFKSSNETRPKNVALFYAIKV